jgi:phage shock protein A
MANPVWTDTALEALARESEQGKRAADMIKGLKSENLSLRIKVEKSEGKIETCEKKIRDLQRHIDKLKREKDALSYAAALLTI